jgi:hypothetical protein
MLNTASVGYNTMSASHPLFDALETTTAPDESDAAGKALIDRLLKVRRSLSPSEQRFGLPKLNLLIEEFRSLIRATPTQREEMILYAVEVQGATTETEISEDTRLHRDVVRDIVQSLYDKDLLYRVSRLVPGSGRPQFAIKSRRLNTPEAD